MPKTFFITTAIDYTNSPPHIGHAYEKVLADVIARYHRLKGENVFFLTGVDQHGRRSSNRPRKRVFRRRNSSKDHAKVHRSLEKAGCAIRRLGGDNRVPRTRKSFREFCSGSSMRARSTRQTVRLLLSSSGTILTDKERGADGEFGPEWGEIEFREEENYYFKLSEHKEWLLRLSRQSSRRSRSRFSPDGTAQCRRKTERRSLHLASEIAARLGNRTAVRHRFRHLRLVRCANELHQLRRLRSEQLTTYEQSTVNFPRSMAGTLQIIGKDILVPAHGIYWLIMLHAIGFPDEQMPQLLVHGWWNLGGAKMSKSVG